MMQKNDWITVGALADGFATNNFVPDQVLDLSGKTFNLYATTGEVISCEFTGQHIMIQEVSQTYKADYRATLIRNNIYFIDFIHNGLSTSILLDLNKQLFTTIIGSLPKEQDCAEHLYYLALANKELTLVTIQIIQGSINIPYNKTLVTHQETDELIGIRNLYRYSPTEVYEHIYLNQHFYTWQCIKGVEAGLADTDRCHYYKIADELYLFIWREKIIPTLGIVLIDMKQHRSYGKICGYQTGDFTNLTNFPVSSHCSLINKTTHNI